MYMLAEKFAKVESCALALGEKAKATAMKEIIRQKRADVEIAKRALKQAEKNVVAYEVLQGRLVNQGGARKRNNGESVDNESVDNGRQGREKQPRTARGAQPAAGGGPVTETTSRGRIRTVKQNTGFTGDEAWMGL